MKLKSGHITAVKCIQFTIEQGNLCQTSQDARKNRPAIGFWLDGLLSDHISNKNKLEPVASRSLNSK